jgi:hypothetical protein
LGSGAASRIGTWYFIANEVADRFVKASINSDQTRSTEEDLFTQKTAVMPSFERTRSLRPCFLGVLVFSSIMSTSIKFASGKSFIWLTLCLVPFLTGLYGALSSQNNL